MKDEVTQLVDRLVGKLLHPCVSVIRQSPTEQTTPATLAKAFESVRLSFKPEPSGELPHAHRP
jgi:hypothetical protein